jgi:hypothetical protein
MDDFVPPRFALGWNAESGAAILRFIAHIPQEVFVCFETGEELAAMSANVFPCLPNLKTLAFCRLVPVDRGGVEVSFEPIQLR